MNEDQQLSQLTEEEVKKVEVKKLGRGLRIALAALIAGGFLFLVSVFGVYSYYSRGLPEMISPADYRPPLVTRVYDQKNNLIGEFYNNERRFLVPFEKISKRIVDAFLAAEDDQFFEHGGFNLQSMLRAFIANMKAGHVVQGGSTITQQVTKSLLLTSEKKFERKVKELILSARLEKNLKKEQILYLYLNQIYLGHGAWGVEAASQTYFRKSCSDLTIAEAAILAGLPQAPSKYSPIVSAKKAKERQEYVLRRLLETKKISKKEHDAALVEQVRIYHDENINSRVSAYTIEHVRRYLIEKYGEKTLYEGGLVVQLPIDQDLSKSARKSLRLGLEAIDQRQGYRGPIKHLKTKAETLEFLADVREKLIDKKLGYKILTPKGELNAIAALTDSGTSDDKLLEVGEIYQALVTGRNLKTGALHISVGATQSEATLDPKKWSHIDRAPSDGDVISVRLIENGDAGPKFEVHQTPQVQGALVSFDAQTGKLLAMEGGYDFEKSEFNRAMQAMRQPGSAYKPIIYAAGLERGFTPATIILDSPIVYNDGDTGKWKPTNYEEKFYGETTFRQALIKSRNVPTIKIVQAIQVPFLIDYSKRLGMNAQFPPDLSISLGSMSASLFEMTKLYALFPRLGRKLNPIFISQVKDRDGKVLEENLPKEAPEQVKIPPLIKVDPQIAAIPESDLTDEELTPEQQDALAKGAAERLLGKGSPSPQPSVEPSGGPLGIDPKKLAPGQKVVIPDYPLEEDADQVLDPRVAYVMTHLMKEVVNYGTGYEAKQLGRPAAGKTGTTNDSIDAWFMGFTPNVVTGVWVGFDNQRPIGQSETGAKAALPIWVNFMKDAVAGYPASDFTIPPNVVFSKIDPVSGKLAPPNSSVAIKEAFIEGTEPTEFVGKRSVKPKSQSDFFKEDTD